MKRSSITKKMIIMVLICMLICTAAFLYFYISDADDEKDDIYADTIISLNEIDNMLDGDIHIVDDESNKDNIVFAKDEIKKLIMELRDYKSYEKARLLIKRKKEQQYFNNDRTYGLDNDINN